MVEEQQDLFAEIMPPARPRHVERLQQVQQGLPERLYLGTTSWSNADWEGLVYPEGCAASDYIEHYAKVFGSVEIDSTWYRIPTAKAVEGWVRRTPEHFRFTAKVPRVISHEKGLVDCMGEMEEFLSAMEPLGERLGPLLMQFPYVARGQDAYENEYGSEFIGRLEEFLPQLPTGDFRFAVEVRNGRWLRDQLLDLLREHGVALVLNNYYTMPDLAQTRRRLDPQTGNFLYLRFLGDRKRMDEYVDGMIERGEKERHWDRLVWDRATETATWARQVREMAGREPEREVYAFFNNHYAGYAPGSLGIFARAWQE
tara:strand:+ start:1558 stop:2496 length:939 start_codon:yes stop_codon:yes gene_type:complete